MIASDKFLRDKAFKIESSPKYAGDQKGLASMICKFFDKKKVSGITTPANKSAIKNKTEQNQHLHKSILLKKLKKEELMYLEC